MRYLPIFIAAGTLGLIAACARIAPKEDKVDLGDSSETRIEMPSDKAEWAKSVSLESMVKKEVEGTDEYDLSTKTKEFRHPITGKLVRTELTAKDDSNIVYTINRNYYEDGDTSNNVSKTYFFSDGTTSREVHIEFYENGILKRKFDTIYDQNRKVEYKVAKEYKWHDNGNIKQEKTFKYTEFSESYDRISIELHAKDGSLLQKLEGDLDENMSILSGTIRVLGPEGVIAQYKIVGGKLLDAILSRIHHIDPFKKFDAFTDLEPYKPVSQTTALDILAKY